MYRTGFGVLVFFTNLSLMEFQVRYLALFLLFSVIDGFEWFCGKSSQEYPDNAGVPQGSILGPTLFLLYINDLPDDVICDIADDTTLYSKCDQAYDLWQQLELASELELDLQDTVDWGRKWFFDFNSGKTQLVSFDRPNNTGAIDVEMDGSALAEKSSFMMMRLTFSSKLDWGSYIISIAKTASKKIGALIRSMKFLSPEVALYLYKSTLRPCMEYCCHAWVGVPSCYLELLDKLQKWICGTVGPSLDTSPLARRRNVKILMKILIIFRDSHAPAGCPHAHITCLDDPCFSDIEAFRKCKLQYPKNPVIGYLNINSLRNKLLT